MKRLYTFVLSAFALTLISCAENTETTENKVSEKEAMTENEPISDSPCDLIGVSDIQTIFGLDAGLNITQEEKDLTYPTCSFKWEDKKVEQVVQVGSTTVRTDIASEVMIVMVKNANEKMFERSTSVYKDGVEVSEVGDKAIWGEKMTQLSVLGNGMMFHIHVKADNDDTVNKAKAIAIAKYLL